MENFYNVIPAAAGTSFVGQNLQGRLAATKYNCESLGMNCMWEFYSCTKGGRLLKCRSAMAFFDMYSSKKVYIDGDPS